MYMVAYEVYNTGLYTFLENSFWDREKAEEVVRKFERLGIKAKIVPFLVEEAADA